MRLLTGPAGSGKTTFVLDRFREALRARNDAVRLLVPTATLARHLQNRFAREGFVFRRDLIQTFSAFVETWAADLHQAPDSVLYLIVEEAARRVARPEFARVVHMPGFCASLARTIGEFSSAGCDSARLVSCLPEAPLSAAFLAVYEEVDRELLQRGLALRARRLAHAAERIAREGLGGIAAIWLDGFHALPDPELDVIAAMARHADLTLTFDGLDSRLAAMGFREERLPRSRPSPAKLLVKAPSIEREVEEIARRILEQSGAGRPFREMGIVVRAKETYVPILRSTLDRFGIPARFYFDSNLEDHPGVRFLTGVMEALLSGWDHDETLAALRLAPQFADSNIMDRFEFAVREQAPNAGLPSLRAKIAHPTPSPNPGGTGVSASQPASSRPLASPPSPQLVNTASDVGQVGNLRPIFNRPADAVRAAPKRPLPVEAAEQLTHLLDELGALEAWLPLKLTPPDWAARFRTLRNLLEQSPLPVSSHEMALEWRAQATALDLFDEALDEAAESFSARPSAPNRQPPTPKAHERNERGPRPPSPNLRPFAPGPWPTDPDERDRSEPKPQPPAPSPREQSELDLPAFWRAVKSVLRLKPLRLDDRRRNVVHVLSAPEARQWVLPVVFVCGMVEKDFPQFHRQDPFFPDAARCSLNARGIRVRTAAEFEREERALFDSAITRATLLVTLFYAEFNSRGDRNLPSIFLEDLILPTQEFRAVRPQPRQAPSVPGPVEIRTPAFLDFLRQKTATVSPSALESYMQCPFQYFGGRVLRLKPAPVRPEDRLDFLTQGNIVHAVLAAWWATRHDLEALFQQIFESALREKKIPPGYHTERLRNAMIEDLQTFAAADRWPRDAFQSSMEEKFQFPLDDSVQVSGKIDRLDVGPGGIAYVIDYKYSGAQRTKERLKNENLVQAPLYLMAAEKLGVNPAGMFYIGLKGGIVYAGWKDQSLGGTGVSACQPAESRPLASPPGPRLVPNPQPPTPNPAPIPYDGDPFPEGWLEHAGERTLQVVQKIRQGRIEVAPADTDNCRFCDCRDVCRVETQEVGRTPWSARDPLVALFPSTEPA